MTDQYPLQNRNILITGGASGLGFGCATRFVRLGARVTIADVNEQAGAQALVKLESRRPEPDTVRFEKVDLADGGSIQHLALRMAKRGVPVDVLVNNAGIYPPSRRTLSKEGQELTFAIAHLGHFRLTHALWPLLKAAGAARVISISSLVQRKARLDLQDLTLERAYVPIRAYQQAKLSCLLFALELHRRLVAAGCRIGSYAAHPGVCRTQLGSNRRVSVDDSLWQKFSSKALSYGLGHIGQTPENGAASVVEAATSTTIPAGAFIGPTGPLEAFGRPGLIEPGPAANDPELAAALWKRSEELTGIQWPW